MPSIAYRRRRRLYSQQERTGATYLPSLTLALPRAQERVHRYKEAAALGWEPAQRVFAPSGVLLGAKTRRIYSARAGRRPYLALGQMRYAAPRAVLVCAKRKVRKEVLFAARVAGRSGAGTARFKKFRRTADSQYGC